MMGAHSLTSCLGQVGGLGKGAPVFTSRAQPSKPCSGRSQKRLLPLLPLWLPLSLACRPPTAQSVWPSTPDSASLFLLSGPLCSPITLCCEPSCQGLLRIPGLCCEAQPQAFSRSERYKPSSSPAFPKACGPMLAGRDGTGVRWVRPWAHSLRRYCPRGCTSAGWAPYLPHPPPGPGWCSVKQGSVVSGDRGTSLHTICHCTLLQSLE